MASGKTFALVVGKCRPTVVITLWSQSKRRPTVLMGHLCQQLLAAHDSLPGAAHHSPPASKTVDRTPQLASGLELGAGVKDRGSDALICSSGFGLGRGLDASICTPGGFAASLTFTRPASLTRTVAACTMLIGMFFMSLPIPIGHCLIMLLSMGFTMGGGHTNALSAWGPRTACSI